MSVSVRYRTLCRKMPLPVKEGAVIQQMDVQIAARRRKAPGCHYDNASWYRPVPKRRRNFRRPFRLLLVGLAARRARSDKRHYGKGVVLQAEATRCGDCRGSVLSLDRTAG